MFEALRKQLQDKEIVSFDLFDTLLFRLVKKPTDIFYLVGQEQLKNQMIQEDISPREFQIIRQEAERLLYTNKYNEYKDSKDKDPEYSLKQIYQHFPAFLHVPSNELEELEIAVEIDNCYLNEVMYEVLKECKRMGKQVFIISDMYFSKSQIERLLTAIGIDLRKDLDGIYVSSEYQQNKKSGKLFQTFLENEKIDSRNMLHIGDDFAADIAGARKAGIESFYFSYKDNLPLSLYYEEMAGKSIPNQLHTLRLMAHYEGKCKGESSYAYELGNLFFGPILAIFTDWLLRQAKKEGRKQIYPLMREGELFEKLLINQINVQGLEELEVKTLYLSRKAVFLPSFEGFNDKLFKECMNKPEHSLSDMFKTLGISEGVQQFSEYKDIFTKDLWKIKGRNLEKEIFEYLSQDSIKQIIDEKINNEKKLLLQYLEEFSIEENYMTCDIGYSGTIPSRMNRLIQEKYGNESMKHYFIFSQSYGKKHYFENTNMKSMFGTLGDNEDEMEKVVLYAYLFEGYFMSDKGSTIGYQYNEDGKVIPILENIHLSKEELEERKAFHRGVLDFQNRYLSVSNQHNGVKLFGKIWENSRYDLLHILQRLFEMPTEKEAKELLRTTFDQNDGSSYIWNFYQKEHFDLCKKVGVENFLREHRKRKYYPNQEVYWPVGIASLCEPQYFINQAAGEGRYGYFRSCQELCDRLKKKQLTEVVVYGAGEVGKELKDVLDIYGIKVKCFIDQNQLLWDQSVEGICVKSLQYMEEQQVAFPVIIASFRFVEEIEENLKRYYAENQIYKLKENVI